MSDLLASPSDLASFLQQDVDTATATMLLECATGAIQALTGQRIVQVVDDVVTLDVDHESSARWLYLPQRPVTAVSTVLVGALPVADFTAQLSRGRLWRLYGWRVGAFSGYYRAPTTVTVTYTHGYPAGHQRLQVARQAALALAGSAYSNPSGAVQERIDDYSVQYDAVAARLDASPALQSLLQRTYGRPTGSVQFVKA
jgi:hypothetical protein